MNSEQLIATLSGIAASINAERDTDVLLKQMISEVCRRLGWYRGTIMSIDLASGYAYVTVRHDPGLVPTSAPTDWALATSPSLVALRDNEPVFIPDAKISAQFPGFQKESIEKGYSSVLVVPMNCNDVQSRPIVLTLVAREVKSLGTEDLALIKLIVQLGAIAIEKQRGLLEQEREAEEKKEVLARHTQWMKQALADDSVQSLAALIGPTLRHPILIFDATTDTFLSGHSPDRRYYSDNEWHGYVDRELGKRLRILVREKLTNAAVATTDVTYSKGTKTLSMVADIHRLDVDSKTAGALIVLQNEEIREVDLLLIESAKQALSVQLMRNLIRFEFDQRNLESVFMELIGGAWTSVIDVTQRALKCGVDVNIPNRLICLSFEKYEKFTESAWSGMVQSLSFFAERLSPKAAVLSRPGAIVVIASANGHSGVRDVNDVAAQLVKELKKYAGKMPTAVVGEACTELTHYSEQYRRVTNILSAATSLGRKGIVSAEMLGPLSMLLLSSELGKVRSFTSDVLGPIFAYDREHQTQFFQTLDQLVESGFRNQICADALGIHVTTLRYRLSRLADLFGVDFNTSSKRFELELAIRISKLLES